MTKVTCVCVLLLISRTIAIEEIACCSPREYMTVDTEAEVAECYALGKEGKAPINVTCKHGFEQFDYDSFVFKNGEVSVGSADGLQSFYNINKYCVHKLYDADANKTEKVGIVCIDAPSTEITAYLLIVSVIFLIITVIIYSAFSELRDLFGKSFINMCGSLAIGFIIFTTLTLHDTENMSECAARGFLAYFFLLTSFFWTTAISIQLFFSTRSGFTSKGWKSFGWYAIPAWGCPIVLTISMAIVNFHPGDHAKPGIGIRYCWFDYEERPQIWYWFYSVLAILISINTAIFIYIYSLFCRIKFKSRQTTAFKNDSCLALKVFGVMGLYWIIELVEQFAEEGNETVIWTILNIVTGLQGLWIFLTWVVFRKRVVKAFYKRGWLFCLSGLAEKWLKSDNDTDHETIEHTTIPLNEQSKKYCVSDNC